MTCRDHQPRPKSFGFHDIRMNWYDYTYARLAWLYGEDRAWAITRRQDEATNADIEAWERLGR